ncbi:hypothetical protein AaE_004588 [Aphanomyces astaci]|uniref:Uncharacterized protein n=1 Tax=Aphanomyces astaci TaxID=112090 RepID=A0A6A5AA78_APHAT|nr:hypothetical protein AaE_004588 [Aphanomyces astaci]
MDCVGGGSDGIETSSDDEDSNFNYDPTAHSDDEIGGFISTDVVASSAATKALVEDLQQLLARNQRLVQDTKLLIYAASDAPLAPDLAPPDLSANIDIHSQRQRTQELEAQNKLLQAMTAHHLNERTTFDARQRERIEMAEMATEEARMWQVRHDLVSRRPPLPATPPTVVSPVLVTPLAVQPATVVPPAVAAASATEEAPPTPVSEISKRRSAGASNELAKHVQMLKQGIAFLLPKIWTL